MKLDDRGLRLRIMGPSNSGYNNERLHWFLGDLPLKDSTPTILLKT